MTTTPNTNPRPSGVFSSLSGQMTVTVAALAFVLLIAWQYVC